MLKFIKHHMTSIDGIEVYPVISFLIFFTFFILLFVYVIKIKNNYAAQMSNIPLTDEPVDQLQNERHESIN